MIGVTMPARPLDEVNNALVDALAPEQLDAMLDEARGLGLTTAVVSTWAGAEYHNGLRMVTLVVEPGRVATERAPLLVATARVIALAAGAGAVMRAWVGLVEPGGAIAPHVDALPASPRRRFHLALATNPAAEFYIDGIAHWWSMPAGTVHEIDPRLEHAVRNLGDTPRVHLVVDAAALTPRAVA